MTDSISGHKKHESLLNDFLSLIFPRTCPGCDEPLYSGEETLCTNCIVKLPLLKRTGFYNEAMHEQLLGRFPIESAYSFMHYHKKSVVQIILHSIKYKNKPELAVDLGRVFATMADSSWRGLDLIIPVPLHRKKQRMRGYNQSQKIALGMSQKCGIPILEDVLVRDIYNESQTRKSRVLRIKNMERVFSVTGAGQVQGKRILLVDDVFTTGATIENCAIVLLNAGAKSVTPVTLATG